MATCLEIWWFEPGHPLERDDPQLREALMSKAPIGWVRETVGEAMQTSAQVGQQKATATTATGTHRRGTVSVPPPCATLFSARKCCAFAF